VYLHITISKTPEEQEEEDKISRNSNGGGGDGGGGLCVRRVCIFLSYLR
jgi:hypothetical protein